MVTNWRKPFRRQMNGQSRDINPDVATETEQRPEDDMVGPLSPVNLLKTSLFHKSSNRHERKPSRSQLYSDRLKIFIGTWNMYGRLLPLDLSYFLTKDEKKSNSQSLSLDGNTSHPYHLLVIGTQECERDISESLINSSKTEWEKKLSNHLGSQYKLIKTETLTAIHIAVFVWVPVAHMIKDVQSDSVKTGWANVIGNKGAVAVSVLFGNRSLLFITCHLRAHQSKLSERNANVERILSELKLPHFNQHKDKKSYPSVIDQFDHVFFFGDTNYRINAKRSTVFDALRRGDYNSLLEHDQLSIERRTEDSPLGVFREHPILFPPTYKLDAISISDSESDSDPITATTNSSTYFADSASEHQTRSSSSRSLKGRHKRLHHHHSSLELQVDPRVPVYGSPSIILRYDSSEKKRIPSWTDRILWCDRASSHHLQPPCVSRSTKKPSFISKSLSVSKTLLNIGPKKQTKPTLCYSYDTILHETILGKSDHLPVVGVYGVYIDKIKPMKVSKPSFSRTSTNVQPSKASVHSKKKRTKFMWWKALVGSQK